MSVPAFQVTVSRRVRVAMNHTARSSGPLEQLLLVRRWTDAGLSLERVRELRSGSPEDPAPRRAAAGSIEVWSRVTVADGLEIHVEPGRAQLTAEQVRQFVRDITALYRQVRTSAAVEPAGNPTSTADPSQEHDHE